MLVWFQVQIISLSELIKGHAVSVSSTSFVLYNAVNDNLLMYECLCKDDFVLFVISCNHVENSQILRGRWDKLSPGGGKKHRFFLLHNTALDGG